MGGYFWALGTGSECMLPDQQHPHIGDPSTKDAGPERETTSTKSHSFPGQGSFTFPTLPGWLHSLSHALGTTQGLGIWHA